MQNSKCKMWRLKITLLFASMFLLAVAMLAAKQAGSTGSAEMKRIYDADQGDRKVGLATMTFEQRQEWGKKVRSRDAERRRQVLELISQNQLQTGEDFDEAANVFQHGETPGDYLLAHTLAIIAIAKGSSKSRWTAAAALDRYLQHIQQPQIFGTQYFIGPKKGDQWTQEPYNRQLIPEVLRREMCVPDQAAQQRTLEHMRQAKPPDEKPIPGC